MKHPADVRVRAIETEELRLMDRAGRVRAVLAMSHTGPSLAMMHEDGTVALEIVLAGDGPGVRLSDGKGETRVFIGATRGAARIGMADGDGSQRLFLGVSSGGTPTAAMYDTDQRRLWTAGKPRTHRNGQASEDPARR
jgi:hypothetical protein